ncbi:MAG: putative septum site-determining protein minC [uncultured bacterium]|nr:MAG: putative septum site-determining protein minC [uncultured bacterium]
MNNFAMLNENLIDLTRAATPASMLLELTNIMEERSLKGQKVRLALGEILLTPDQISNMKTIFASAGAQIEIIYTKSLNTQLTALSAGLAVSEHLPSQEELLPQAVTAEPAESIDTNFQEIDEQYETEKALEDILEQESNHEENQFEGGEEVQGNKAKTLYLKQTLRSGQTVNFDGNIVIIGDCHPGSEIVVAGDIVVWGILSGIAHAGSGNNYKASIRALKINAIQLRIADLYARKPDRLAVEKAEKATSFMPEEARISDGEIKIYSLNG